jgi:hypothetical protein
MVNVFVKSTKVPRPANSRIVKTFNRLKPLPPSSATVNSLNGDNLNHGAAITPSVASASADIKEEEHLCYAGNINIPITSQLKIVMPGVDDTPRGIWPVFRMMVCLHVVCVVVVIDMKVCFSIVLLTLIFHSLSLFLYQPLSLSNLYKG